MKRLLLYLAVFASTALGAQTHCDGVRYATEVFENIDSTINLKYGENVTANGAMKELFLDVYYPESEFFFRRPLVLLAHGGSFVSGQRKQLRQLCIELAQRGFVAATIDYRLYDNFNMPLDSLVIYDVAIRAAGDMKAAVRWFKEEADGANEYGIDTNLIVIGGVSAGAVTALHYAFLDSNDYSQGTALDSIIDATGGIRGNSSSNYQYSDRIIGVLNYSGALKDARWIDAGEPTVFSVHDEFDPVVPYGQDETTELGTPVEVSGSARVHEEAQLDGIRSQLITIEGSDEHVSYFLGGEGTDDYKLAVDSSSLFLEYTVCGRINAIREDARLSAIKLLPNPASNTVRVESTSKISGIRLLDINGRVVKTETFSDHRASLNLTDFSPGTYVAEIAFTNGSRSIEKLVLDR